MSEFNGGVFLECSVCGYGKEVDAQLSYSMLYGDQEVCPICGGNWRRKAEEKEKNFEALYSEGAITKAMEDNFKIGASQNVLWDLMEKIKDVKKRVVYRRVFFKVGGSVPQINFLKEVGGKLLV